MKKGWTTTKLITIGAIAVLRFLIGVVFYTTVLASTGNIFSGLTYGVIGPFFIVFVSLLINQFGAAAIYLLLVNIFTMTLPTILPLFTNLFLIPVKGFSVDGVNLLLAKKHRALSGFVCGFVHNLLDYLMMVIIFFTVGLPSAKNIPSFLISFKWITLLGILLSVLGGISGYLAQVVYNKLSRTSIVKRIQK